MNDAIETGFVKYLRRLPPKEAAEHFFDCLKDGGTMAYAVMESANGEGWTLNKDTFQKALMLIFGVGTS